MISCNRRLVELLYMDGVFVNLYGAEAERVNLTFRLFGCSIKEIVKRIISDKLWSISANLNNSDHKITLKLIVGYTKTQ